MNLFKIKCCCGAGPIHAMPARINMSSVIFVCFIIQNKYLLYIGKYYYIYIYFFFKEIVTTGYEVSPFRFGIYDELAQIKFNHSQGRHLRLLQKL